MRKGVMLGFGMAAVILAGCGSSSKSATSANASGPTTTAAPAAQQTTTPAAASSTTISLRQTSLGYVVVDATGRTLYQFAKDTATTSNCTGGCATAWPALTSTSPPTAGANLDASKLGTIMRADGSQQVTYAGHPLYRYAADSAPGDTKGEGVGGFWYAVTSSGSAAQAASSGGTGY